MNEGNITTTIGYGMSPINLVNTSPGDDLSVINPIKPIYTGIRSITNSIVLGTLNMWAGFTNIQFNGVLPELNPVVNELDNLHVDFDSAEHFQPISGTASRFITAGSLEITTTTNSPGEQGIYSVSYPCDITQSACAYIKFRRDTSWITTTPDWGGSGVINIPPVYISLEYGPKNTSYTVFLTSGVTGTFTVGGPASFYSASAPRPALTTYSTVDWQSISNGQSIELWIMVNLVTETVDLWCRLQGTTTPVLVGSILQSQLGVFPTERSTTNVQNFRSGPSSIAKFYFGVGGASIGQSLIVDDWAMYQDLRQCILNGLSTANNKNLINPDCPVQYFASDNVIPNKSNPSKWLTGSNPANAAMVYQPGVRSKYLYTTFKRTSGTTEVVFRREEPQLISGGIAIEAYLSGTASTIAGNTTNMGLGLDDGIYSYYLVLINDASGNSTFGILKNSTDPTLLSNYYALTSNYNYSAFHLVKLIVDRARAKVLLFIDDMNSPALTIPISNTFPASPTVQSYIKFGHFPGTTINNSLNVSYLSYCSRYKAWEGIDNVTPDTTGNPATQYTQDSSGAGNSILMTSKGITIKKPSFNTPSTKLTYLKLEKLNMQSGMQVDFRMGIISYKDIQGASFGPNTHTGLGLSVYLGGKKLDLRFIDCGIYGRKIAIIPGSGSELDIINQTSLGQQFSSTVDWTIATSYRAIIKAYDSIKIWTGSILNPPDIIIPWRDDTNGFDLPTNSLSSAIEFGHFEFDSSSVSSWEFVRYSISDGFDISVTQSQPLGADNSLFSGRSFELLNVSDN